MSRILKKVGILWFFYILVVNAYLLILDLLEQVDVKVHTIKEICFALWGWGWDGMHYLKIATQGYEFPLQAFFPLYPLVIKLADVFLPFTLAYRINVVLLLFVLIFSYFLMGYMKIEEGRRLKVMLSLLAFPTAFFLQANYSETLYILLSVIGLLLLLKKKYFLASVFAGLLSAEKISGVSLGLVIAVSYILDHTNYLKQVPQNLLKHVLKLVLISVISLSGFFGYMFYLNTQFGSYTEFFHAQSKWGRDSVSGTKNFQQLVTGYYMPIVKAIKTHENSLFRRFSEVGAFVMAVIFLWLARKKLPLELWLFSFLQVLIPISSGTFLSFNRLVLLAFPLLYFGFNLMLDRKKLYWAVFSVFLIMQFVGIYLFFNNVFIG